jgi:hypothetical protein
VRKYTAAKANHLELVDGDRPEFQAVFQRRVAFSVMALQNSLDKISSPNLSPRFERDDLESVARLDPRRK